MLYQLSYVRKHAEHTGALRGQPASPNERRDGAAAAKPPPL